MNLKLVVTVPLSHADIVRDAIGKAGGGKVGNIVSVLSQVVVLDVLSLKKEQHPTLAP
jgi:hypothetical protein